MLKLLRICTLCTLILSLAGPAWAQAKKGGDKPAAAKKGKAPKNAAMEAMAKAAEVGPQHAVLKLLAGSFTTATTAWMAPGKKPVKSTGTAENTMILGDRFLMEEFSGKMMGQPFAGRGLSGYDNTKKKYVFLWVDSMSTALMTMEGTADEAGKVITVEGEYIDPATNTTKKARGITTVDSDKKHTFQWLMVAPDGKAQKMMEIVYTRK